MTGILWTLAGVALLEAAALAAIVASVIRQLDWLRAVLVPWVNAINTKLELPK